MDEEREAQAEEKPMGCNANTPHTENKVTTDEGRSSPRRENGSQPRPPWAPANPSKELGPWQSGPRFIFQLSPCSLVLSWLTGNDRDTRNPLTNAAKHEASLGLEATTDDFRSSSETAHQAANSLEMVAMLSVGWLTAAVASFGSSHSHGAPARMC